MSRERRFRAWNILDSALHRGGKGHHYWEAKTLVEELRSRGETVRIFSHRNAPAAEEFPGVEIIPTFSLNLWDSVSKDPVWSDMENLIVHTRTFHSDLSAHAPSLFDHSVVLFPTFKEMQLLGLLRWLSDIPEEARPAVAACLVSQPAWSPNDRSARLYKSLWTSCPPALKKKLALFCRTPLVAERFVKHTGIPVGVLPFAAPSDVLASTSPKTEGPMVVSFVGGGRLERGTALMADIVRQCAESGVRFFVQAKRDAVTGTGGTALAELARWPHVQVHEGVLDRDDYYKAIAHSVVLLAYQPISYRWRVSGVYLEALMLDAPVLVTKGTWMAEDVKTFGNGLIIKDFAASSVVDCIGRAQRELPALRQAAAGVGQQFRRTHGVARYLSTVSGAFEGDEAV
jgi:hypothetical protein